MSWIQSFVHFLFEFVKYQLDQRISWVGHKALQIRNINDYIRTGIRLDGLIILLNTEFLQKTIMVKVKICQSNMNINRLENFLSVHLCPFTLQRWFYTSFLVVAQPMFWLVFLVVFNRKIGCWTLVRVQPFPHLSLRLQFHLYHLYYHSVINSGVVYQCDDILLVC